MYLKFEFRICIISGQTADFHFEDVKIKPFKK